METAEITDGMKEPLTWEANRDNVLAVSGSLFPTVQSVLRLSPCFTVHCTHPMPSRWVRFWQWALLGWTWESVTKS